jgi:hypothetical protein
MLHQPKKVNIHAKAKSAAKVTKELLLWSSAKKEGTELLYPTLPFVYFMTLW